MSFSRPTTPQDKASSLSAAVGAARAEASGTFGPTAPGSKSLRRSHTVSQLQLRPATSAAEAWHGDSLSEMLAPSTPLRMSSPNSELSPAAAERVPVLVVLLPGDCACREALRCRKQGAASPRGVDRVGSRADLNLRVARREGTQLGPTCRGQCPRGQFCEEALVFADKALTCSGAADLGDAADDSELEGMDGAYLINCTVASSARDTMVRSKGETATAAYQAAVFDLMAKWATPTTPHRPRLALASMSVGCAISSSIASRTLWKASRTACALGGVSTSSGKLAPCESA